MTRRTIGIALGGVFIVLAAIGSVSPLPAEAAGPGTWTAAAAAAMGMNRGESVLLASGRVLFASSAYDTPAFLGQTYNPATDTWLMTGPLVTPRGQASLTLLRDGRVLIAGGYGGSGPLLTSSEFYSAATNTWSAGPTMVGPGTIEHTATLLPDGRVLVTGGGESGGSHTDATQLFDPVANTWTAGAAMSVRRGGHRAVLLQDGRVMVAGGNGSIFGAPYASAEIYDPATDTWSPAGSLTAARAVQFTMTMLPDGQVLVVGGRASIPFSPPLGAETYDPVTDAWTVTSAMTVNRAAHRAVLLGIGKVLVSGGQVDFVTDLSSSELFDPATGLWAPSGSMSMPRSFHTLNLLSDGRVLAASDDAATTSAELYDATSWQTVASVTPGRQGAAASILHSGKVVVAGSGSGEAYDPALDQWTATGAMIENRRFHTATLLASGKVLVAGGYTPGFMPIATSELYDPLTNAWSSSAAMAAGGGFSRTVRLSNNKVLFVGNSGPAASMAELYDPGTNTWSAAGTLAPQFEGTLTALANGKVLLAGGYYFLTPTQQVDQTTAQLYDPATNVWSPTGSMGIARSGQGATRMSNGRVLVMGGDSASGSAEIYDAGTGAWTAAGAMAVARHHFASALLEDGTIIVAGGLTGVTYVGDAEIYHPSTDTWTAAGTLAVPRAYQPSVLMTDGSWLLPGGSGTSTHGLPSVERYDLGIHTDTDSDGYNDGLELALGQHPWSHCKTMRADLTGDGIVNSGDQGKLASKFGQRPPPSRVDQNGDKILNSGDQGLMASVFNKSVLMCA